MGLSGCTCNHILVVAFKEKEKKEKTKEREGKKSYKEENREVLLIVCKVLRYSTFDRPF